MPIIKQGDLTGLTDRHAAFVIEYIKDFKADEAAVRAGYSPGTGYDLLQRDDVRTAIENILSKRLDLACIDADWHLQQLVDNHVLARQEGKLSQSNAALREIGRHAAVDSYSAEKVHIVGDEEIRARLNRGRKRVQEKESDPAPSLDFTQPPELDFS
jgi:phage terminase small subunit